MRSVGIAADHGGFALKEELRRLLPAAEVQWVDFGANSLDPLDDYPDYAVPLAKAVAAGQVEVGIIICGSGVGACVAANKVRGARAALITDCFSAHQGVEDDNMNIICLGGRVTGWALAVDLVKTFLGARYVGAERFERRLQKIAAVEQKESEDE
jgi:ribose 5-phosphate isomerase B